jgi:hypothetical protein
MSYKEYIELHYKEKAQNNFWGGLLMQYESQIAETVDL